MTHCQSRYFLHVVQCIFCSAAGYYKHSDLFIFLVIKHSCGSIYDTAIALLNLLGVVMSTNYLVLL